MDERVVAYQWGCDMPLKGSEYQAARVDYQLPPFAESPDLLLPAYALTVSTDVAALTAELHKRD